MSKIFVLAPDAFKESMSAEQACQAMQRGIQKVIPDACIIQVPMADGGEGTVDALISSLRGQQIPCEVTGDKRYTNASIARNIPTDELKG